MTDQLNHRLRYDRSDLALDRWHIVGSAQEVGVRPSRVHIVEPAERAVMASFHLFDLTSDHQVIHVADQARSAGVRANPHALKRLSDLEDTCLATRVSNGTEVVVGESRYGLPPAALIAFVRVSSWATS